MDEKGDLYLNYEDEMVRIFARGVSHNFNNLLTAGMGYLSLAMDQCEDQEQILLLKNVELCHRRIAQLSKQLLAFTGDSGFAPRPVSVYDLLRGALNFFDAVAMKHKSLLICDFHAVKDVIVNVDEFQISQAIVQLLNNASESYDDQHGKIFFAGSLDDNNAVITIRDCGKGMRPEQIEHIIKPFYSCKQNVGVGMGLSVSKSMVEKSGGTIEIESALGEGTTIKISFPLATGFNGEAESAVIDSSSLRGELRVLLAIDAEDSLLAMQSVLYSYGMVVETVDDEEALEQVLKKQANRYDLIIVDLLQSTIFSGAIIDLVRQYTTSPLVYLYSCALEDPGEIPGVAVIAKPYEPQDLIQELLYFPSLQV